MLEHRPDRDLAAGLEVDPDPDHELGVAFEQVLQGGAILSAALATVA
jgi:hypothetical protein